MRRILPVALAAAIAAAMITLMAQTELATMSARCAVSAMMGAIIVAFAVTAGAAASDAILTHRRGVRLLVDAMPRRARWRLAWRRIGAITLGGGAGVLCAVSIGLAVASINGSAPSWQAITMVPLSLLVVAAAAALGWAAGARVNSWFLPPLLVVTTYAMMAGNFANARLPFALFGGSPPGPAFSLPSPDVYLAASGFWVSATALGMAFVFWWASRGSASAIGSAATALIAVVIAVAVVAGAVGRAQASDALNVPEDQTDWPCVTTQRDAIRICAPPDRRDDLGLLSTQLPPLHKRFTELDPGLNSRTWSASVTSGRAVLVYLLPLGREISSADHAREALDGLFRPCVVSAALEPDSTRFERLMSQLEQLADWLSTDRTSPQEDADAKNSYAQLMACR